MPTPMTRRAAFRCAASAVSSFMGIALLAACGTGQSVGAATAPASSTAAAVPSAAPVVTSPTTSASAAGSAVASSAAVVARGPDAANVLTFSNPLFQESKAALIAALAKADPSLQANITVFPGQIDQFREKVLALYGGGDVPDAQWLHPSITALMAGGKLVQPVDDLAAKDAQSSLSSFYQAVLDEFRWQGKAIGLPWYSPGYALVYNKDLFARLGLTTPEVLDSQQRWTWDGFAGTLRSLTRPAGGTQGATIGMQAESSNLDWFCAWIWRNGGEIFSADLKQCVMNQPAAADAVQKLSDLYLKDQAFEYSANAKQFPNAFLGGQIGLRQMDKEQVAPARHDLSTAAFALGMAPIYSGPAGRINRMGPLAFGIPREAKNADAGWRWTRFMGGPDAATVLMLAQSTLPVRPDFAKLPAFATSMQPWENGALWLDSMVHGRALVQPANYAQVATLWTQTWTDILARKAVVQTLLDDFVRQANAALAKA
jgi:multiple sugar transport system substrate-binding protein